MKRALYLMPLMAATALTFSLGACDDKSDEKVSGGEADGGYTSSTAPTTTAEAPATPTPAPTVTAEGATAYATAPGVTNGAVFLTLHNQQAQADKLIGANTPVATSVEIHESMTDANGVIQMNKVDAIEIQSGQQVSLKPDGYHLMLMGLNVPLTEGTPFDITLDFESAPDVTLSVTVTAPGATASDATATMDHNTMDHGTMDHGTMTHEEPPPTDTTTSTTPTDEPMTDPAASPTDTTAPATDAPVADEQPAD